MIRLLLLDLGDTLVHEGAVLPHVPEALTALAQLRTRGGDPLVCCLVSDVPLAVPPDDPEAIAREFERHLALLDGLGLREPFEPVDERVTLSTHAGACKPDARVFDLAIERSGVGARREECLFVSGHRAEVDAARALGLDGLVFARGRSEPADFHDWSRAPALIHHRVAPEDLDGLAPSLSAWLDASDDLEITRLRPAARKGASGAALRGSGRSWVPLEGKDLGPLDGAMVQLPVSVAIDLDERGGVARVERGQPDADALAEARQQAKRLLARHEVALEGEDPPGSTFEVRTDARGRRRLQRRRYSG